MSLGYVLKNIFSCLEHEIPGVLMPKDAINKVF